jgi:hypothetical protein
MTELQADTESRLPLVAEALGYAGGVLAIAAGIYMARDLWPGLSTGGDRQANHALWQIVITRMSSHPATRAYVARRTAEGRSKKEIIRCLKRYVARQVYPCLRGIG